MAAIISCDTGSLWTSSTVGSRHLLFCWLNGTLVTKVTVYMQWNPVTRNWLYSAGCQGRGGDSSSACNLYTCVAGLGSDMSLDWARNCTNRSVGYFSWCTRSKHMHPVWLWLMWPTFVMWIMNGELTWREMDVIQKKNMCCFCNFCQTQRICFWCSCCWLFISLSIIVEWKHALVREMGLCWVYLSLLFLAASLTSVSLEMIVWRL